MEIKENLIFWISMIFLLEVFVTIFIPEENSDYSFSNKNDNNHTEEVIITDDFYSISELHWLHMPITYDIINEDFCTDMELFRIRLAFDIIKNSTDNLMSFNEVNSNGDINISCFDIQEELLKIQICENITFKYRNNKFRPYETHLDEETQEIASSEVIKRTDNETIFKLCHVNYDELPFDSSVLGDERYFTAGHALPIIENNIIISAEIAFFVNDGMTGTCSFPLKEIHEILHSFGFGHNIHDDIMNPYSNCFVVKHIDEKYTSCLKYIYSNKKEGNCSKVEFIKLEYDECGIGLYPIENSDYCCPEPNMIIDEEGYCV